MARKPSPITVTLNSVELDAEARLQRAIRARELLDGASWAFDELISEGAREFIATDPANAELREAAHRQIHAVTGLKAHLLTIVNNHIAEAKRDERRNRNERPADHE